MLLLLQIIEHMLGRLEYSEDEVIEAFEKVEDRLPLEILFDVIGLETPSEREKERLYRALPKWRSALAIAKLRQEEGTSEKV